MFLPFMTLYDIKLIKIWLACMVVQYWSLAQQAAVEQEVVASGRVTSGRSKAVISCEAEPEVERRGRPVN